MPIGAAVDLPRFRTEYTRKSLDEKDVDRDGLRQFIRWLNEAVAAKVNEPNAMTLATASMRWFADRKDRAVEGNRQRRAELFHQLPEPKVAGS